ncbi:PBECR4 domain-containing protein [Vagococcus carniphilus]|uniref:PBECR4 domain-containing protein n=1 Tax=Vagococcus carniphilus TaxID=218144 RepID=UPI00288DC7A7|nr:PBECR4 domain-containing protein [Vagococcus carniphilus]MDT2813790.1 PBECR4 domain-containing protein [Vagococcus carniphilus]
MCNLLDVVNEFDNKYNGKRFVCHTAYTPVSLFTIKFDNKQLPHLLGLHKIYKSNPAVILDEIITGKITNEKVKRHKNYGYIKDRFSCCLFLNQIFENDSKMLFYISEIDKRNTMKLDIAFYESLSNKKYVLGLRKISGDNYAPTTFYSVKSNRKEFTNSKRVQINKIDCID